VEISGFSVFVLLVGRIGSAELAATSIAFNINTLAFMPMIGFGVAISVIVGQFQGEERPDRAERSVFSASHICFTYMTLVAATFFLLPQIYIAAFAARADEFQFREIREFVVMMLRFVAVYTLFDTLNIVFASALKGAGDTRFVMIMIVCLSVGGLTIPSYLLVVVFNTGIVGAWFLVSAYVIALGGAFLFRFLSGKWKSMRVIEAAGARIPLSYPEVPTAESEV
jgi:MATE family multidrug resistance protein